MTKTDVKDPWWRVPGIAPVYSMFFLEAFVLGNWIPRIPDVKLLFGFSASQLGLCLFVVASGTLIAFLVGGHVLKRLGIRRAYVIAMPGWAMGICLVPFMPNGIILGFLLFAAGISIGLLEVAMNTAANRLEVQSGRRLMSKAHGFWSIGSLVGALMGGAIGSFDVSIEIHFLAVLPLTALIALVFAATMPKPATAQKETSASGHDSAIKLPPKGLVLLCIMPIGIMIVEGVFIDWSALFVRDVLAGGALASGLIYSAFSLVMAATRLNGDWLIDEYGPLRVARVSAVSATFGIALFALAPNAAVAFIAALFAGLGTAIFYPLTMSEAANRPGSEEDNVSAMSLFAFSAFMLAPPILGAIIDLTNMRVAVLLVAPLAATSLLLTNELTKGKSG